MISHVLRTALLVPLLVLGLSVLPGRASLAAMAPVEVIETIARGCAARQYSDVSEYLHSSLRRTWMQIGYKVKDFCDLITRNYTLKSLRIDKEEQAGNHALVFLTYIYRDGSEHGDRAALLEERGGWKLVN